MSLEESNTLPYRSIYSNTKYRQNVLNMSSFIKEKLKSKRKNAKKNLKKYKMLLEDDEETVYIKDFSSILQHFWSKKTIDKDFNRIKIERKRVPIRSYKSHEYFLLRKSNVNSNGSFSLEDAIDKD